MWHLLINFLSFSHLNPLKLHCEELSSLIESTYILSINIFHVFPRHYLNIIYFLRFILFNCVSLTIEFFFSTHSLTQFQCKVHNKNIYACYEKLVKGKSNFFKSMIKITKLENHKNKKKGAQIMKKNYDIVPCGRSVCSTQLLLILYFFA